MSKHVAVKRDGHRCVQCGVAGKYNNWPWRTDKPLPKLEVDHIVAVKDGGSHHPDNLRTLCRECHKKRTAEQRKRKADATP